MITAKYKERGRVYRVVVMADGETIVQEEGRDSLGDPTWKTVEPRGEISKGLANELVETLIEQGVQPPVILLCEHEDCDFRVVVHGGGAIFITVEERNDTNDGWVEVGMTDAAFARKLRIMVLAKAVSLVTSGSGVWEEIGNGRKAIVLGVL